MIGAVSLAFTKFRLGDTNIFTAEWVGFANFIRLFTSFFFSYNLIIMKTYFEQIPYELEEAAIIDGCSRIQVLYKIIMPLALPAMITIAVRDSYVDILVDKYPYVSHTQEETDLFNDKYTEITTYTDEMINKFIMGAEPLNKFDDFIAQLEKMGITEVVKAKQAAYDRYTSR